MGRTEYRKRRQYKKLISMILQIAGLELENLLCKKIIWIFNAAYVILMLAVCLWDYLRQSYFTVMESVPVMLMNFVAPVFLAMILIGVLSPVFAGDREQNVNQIPATCLVGRRGRSTAKLLASVLFSILACLFMGGTTFIVPYCCRLFDGDLRIEYIGTGLELTPVWTVWQHFVFSLVSLTAACIILTLFTLFVSYNAKTTITAVSISGFSLIFEFLFHRFSFPTLIQEYNVWVFFEPYYFFVMNIFHDSPTVNLLLLWTAFLPLSIIVVWQVSRNGE